MIAACTSGTCPLLAPLVTGPRHVKQVVDAQRAEPPRSAGSPARHLTGSQRVARAPRDLARGYPRSSPDDGARSGFCDRPHRARGASTACRLASPPPRGKPARRACTLGPCPLLTPLLTKPRRAEWVLRGSTQSARGLHRLPARQPATSREANASRVHLGTLPAATPAPLQTTARGAGSVTVHTERAGPPLPAGSPARHLAGSQRVARAPRDHCGPRRF